MPQSTPVSFAPPIDPSTYAQQIQLQRQQQIADALLQQAQTPMGADLPQNLRVVPRLGVAGGLIKLAQALGAGYLEKKVTDQRAGLMQQQMQNMQGLFGGGGGAPAAQASPYAPAQAVMAQPGQGQLGPTNAAAAQVPAARAPAGPPIAAPTAQGGPMLIPGMDPQIAMRWYMTDPGAYMKALGEAVGPTTEQKNWRAQGVDPRQLAGGTLLAGQRQGMTDVEKLQDARARLPEGSPLTAQIDAAIAKANYVAPAEVKAGNFALDANNRPIFYNPGFDKGIVPTGMGAGPGGISMPTQATAVPGYAPAAAGITAADTAARTDESIHTATGPNGAPITGRGKDVFGSSRIPPAVQAARDSDRLPILQNELKNPDLSPSDKAAVQREIDRLPGVVRGQSTTDAEINKAAADPIASAPQQVQASKAAITGLQTALDTLRGVRATGPGTMKTTEVLAALRNAGIPVAKDGVETYQSLAKYLQNSLNAAANGSSAGGSDARFESFMHGQPNAETMNKEALEGAIRYVLSQHDAAAARGNFLTQAYQAAKAKGDPNPALVAQQQWASVYNPEYFRVQRMAPADQAQAINAMSPKQAQHFIQWRQAMGAFQ